MLPVLFTGLRASERATNDISGLYIDTKLIFVSTVSESCLFDDPVASGEGAVRQTPKIARFCLPESLVDGLPEYCRGRVKAGGPKAAWMMQRLRG